MYYFPGVTCSCIILFYYIENENSKWHLLYQIKHNSCIPIEGEKAALVAIDTEQEHEEYPRCGCPMKFIVALVCVLAMVLVAFVAIQVSREYVLFYFGSCVTIFILKFTCISVVFRSGYILL